MSSVLYWNIQQFAENKINRPKISKRSRDGSTVTNDTPAKSADRRAYIVRHVNDLDPDIFVVVELSATFNANRGALCTGAGKTGGQFLLGLLQAINLNWRLIPALITGANESVAVFFRSDRVEFTGPSTWTGGNGPIAGVIAGNYPVDWPLPAGNVNAASAFRANAALNQSAANVFYQDNAMPPVDIDFGTSTRTPYQTTFWDIVNNRNINIFTVHAPTATADATTFLQNMALSPGISGAPVTNEVRLILGDFNLLLLTPDPDFLVPPNNTYTDCYAPLTAINAPAVSYKVALLPNVGAGIPPAPLLGYRGYFGTQLAEKPTCWSTATNIRYYPYYAYFSATKDSIDNILYWANPVIANQQITVINGVVGSPYDVVGAGATPANIAPHGTAIFATDIPCMLPNAPATAPTKFAWAVDATGFAGWNQYGKIYSTSDHLPLFFTF